MNSIKTMIDASSFVDNFETYANTQHTKRVKTHDDPRTVDANPKRGREWKKVGCPWLVFFWYAPTPAMGKKEPGKKKNKTKQPHTVYVVLLRR